MSKRFETAIRLLAILALFGASGAVSTAFADDSESSDTSQTTAERPDFSGRWTARIGSFIRTEKREDGICVINCGPPPGAAEKGAAPRRPPMRKPEFPAYREEQLDKVARLKKEQVLHDPALRCQNPGLPRIGPPDKIVQTDDELVILYDDLNGAFWRVIPTDGREHREYAERNYFGDSVGRWEGDTLVIESVSFTEDSWLTDNGAFHTEDLRVVEELSLGEEEGTITYRVTVHDPAVLAEPWVRERTLRPSDKDLLEPVPCIEESIDKMTDITSYHPNSRW